ncbi:MAG TPA: hypothetical protein VK652_05315 [Steroidobacteraceae bacterium]|nr:hypothetical protein [Steroidobacteraceae bacterium]
MNGMYIGKFRLRINARHPTAMPRTWPFVVVSIVLTPLLLYVALASAGAGHGSYFWAKVLFPYTMLAAKVVNSITPALEGLAIAQMPIYGLLMGLGAKAWRVVAVIFGLVVIHGAAVVACFVVPMTGNFP